jgi:hypothetical protein
MKSRMMMAALAAAVLVLGAVQSSMASIRTIGIGDVVTVRHGGINYRTGNGGEFQLGLDGVENNYFHTFCAENDEDLGGNNQKYLVKSIGTVTKDQGAVLTTGIARLFRDYYDAMQVRSFGFEGVTGGSYAAGSSTSFTLAGGAVTFDMSTAATRSASGRSVQIALWNMLYGSGLGGNANAIALKNYYSALANTGEYYSVRFANLIFSGGSRNGQDAQDQFVVIPEPGSLLVWGVLGLAGVGMTNRRRKG